DFRPPSKPPDPPIAISRRNFVELCGVLVHEDEQKFEELWRHLGLSVDWGMTYTTVGTAAQRVSQRAFLRNLARGEAYQTEAPTLWDVDFRTAVAQAELEDRDDLHVRRRHGRHVVARAPAADAPGRRMGRPPPRVAARLALEQRRAHALERARRQDRQGGA